MITKLNIVWLKSATISVVSCDEVMSRDCQESDYDTWLIFNITSKTVVQAVHTSQKHCQFWVLLSVLIPLTGGRCYLDVTTWLKYLDDPAWLTWSEYIDCGSFCKWFCDKSKSVKQGKILPQVLTQISWASQCLVRSSFRHTVARFNFLRHLNKQAKA